MKPMASARAAGLAAAISACLGGAAFAGHLPTNAILNSGVLKKQLPASPSTSVTQLQCVVSPATSVTLPSLSAPGWITVTTPQQVVITNDLSITIPAGTAYSYSFQGGNYLSTDHTKLAPGKILTIGLGSNFHIVSQFSCVASVPL